MFSKYWLDRGSISSVRFREFPHNRNVQIVSRVSDDVAHAVHGRPDYFIDFS